LGGGSYENSRENQACVCFYSPGETSFGMSFFNYILSSRLTRLRVLPVTW
jgi:hypothetical protein